MTDTGSAGVPGTLDVWLRKYIPWLFFLTLAVILVGQGAGVVPANTLAFRMMQAAPILVVVGWLALKAAALIVVNPGRRGGRLQHTAMWAWVLVLLVVATTLAYFAVRVLAGS